MVEGDRLVHDAEQRLAPIAVELVFAAGVVADRDAGSCRQTLDRLHEVAALDVTKKGDGVTRGLATEAEVETLLGIDRERCGLLGVKRAQADVAAPDPLERRVFPNEGEDVGRGPDLPHVLLGNGH